MVKFNHAICVYIYYITLPVCFASGVDQHTLNRETANIIQGSNLTNLMSPFSSRYRNPAFLFMFYQNKAGLINISNLINSVENYEHFKP